MRSALQRNRCAVAGPPDYGLIQPYTKSTPIRMASMVAALHDIDDMKTPGDIVECGVWRGGNIMLARMIRPDRVCWAYDTFDGMTEPDHELDVKPSGQKAIDRYNTKKAGGTKWDAVSLDEVMDGFVTLGIDMDRVHFVEGPVETSIDTVAPLRIALLRLDMDWYLPTKVAMEKLYPRLSPGGILIVDDYGHWMGCKKAVDEFFGSNRPQMHEVDYSCVVFRKC